MSGLRSTAVLVSTLAVLALTVGNGDTTTLVAGALALTFAAAVTVRLAVGVVAQREVPVGSRARSHRQLVAGSVEPAHPSTPGRPLSRAPSVVSLAA